MVDWSRQWFFLHIPKCAGTTFIQLLDQCFVQDEILPEHDRFLPLRGWRTDEIRRYAWIRGHFPYTEIVPRLTAAHWKWILIRDPVEMFLSHVEMRRRLFYPDEELSQRVYGKPLQDVLRDEVAIAYFNNFATKMLGGIFPAAHPNDDPTWVWSEVKVDLNTALQRLWRFDWVGLVERFDESLQHLSYLLGFPFIRGYRKANVSPRRPRKVDLEPAMLQRIEEINAWDMRLYSEARRVFERQRHEYPDIKYNLAQVDSVEDDLWRVYPGQGWYPGERHRVHGIVRWTGPERSARLFYPLRPGKTRLLRVEIVNWAAEDLIEGLRCEVNGIPLTAQRRQVLWEDRTPGWVLEAKVPAEYWRKEGWQEVALYVPRTVQLPGESRMLGVCCRRVEIR